MNHKKLFQIFFYLLILQIITVAAATIYDIKYSYSSLIMEALTTKEMSRFVETPPVDNGNPRINVINHLLYILGETENQLEHKQKLSKLDNNSAFYLQTLKSMSYQGFLNPDNSKNMNMDCYKNATNLHDCIVKHKLTNLSIEEYNNLKNIFLKNHVLQHAAASLFDTISEENNLKLKKLEIRLFSLVMIILNIAALFLFNKKIHD